MVLLKLLLLFTLTFGIFFGWPIYAFWHYYKHYTFKKQFGHVWHKCIVCKKAEPTMYYSQSKYMGVPMTIYKCDKHAFEIKPLKDE